MRRGITDDLTPDGNRAILFECDDGLAPYAVLEVVETRRVDLKELSLVFLFYRAELANRLAYREELPSFSRN
jgi:hypothetical protein